MHILIKQKKYVKYHGKANFSEGGQAHDVLKVVKDHGLVPEEFYKGLNYGMSKHNHSEMVSMLEGMLENMISSRRLNPTIAWLPAFEGVVETYLGKAPQEFKYDNKKYDPIKFAKEVVGIIPDDYVELTSYKEYPYYEKVDLEIPDNWSHDLYYNVPPNDLMRIIDNALSTGYSVCWDGDVSEEEFSHKDGTAVLALEESDGIILQGIENMRQQTFNSYATTDDHLMHLTGLARDKNNAVFYLTKNSWGTDGNKFGGYLYMSKWYVQLKTVAIMVHKDAIPKDLIKKLKL
jgi:bleomycin hydrolase